MIQLSSHKECICNSQNHYMLTVFFSRARTCKNSVLVNVLNVQSASLIVRLQVIFNIYLILLISQMLIRKDNMNVSIT